LRQPLGDRDNEAVEERQSLTDERPAGDERAETDERGLRFSDPYWDDAFCAWWDPTLRTCC
jgi:hypothetical protein